MCNPALIEKRITKLLRNKEKLKIYMLLKYEEEDWHGCQDCGSDLRDIESQIMALRLVLTDMLESRTSVTSEVQ